MGIISGSGGRLKFYLPDKGRNKKIYRAISMTTKSFAVNREKWSELQAFQEMTRSRVIVLLYIQKSCYAFFL